MCGYIFQNYHFILKDEIHIDEICCLYSYGDQYENNSNLSFFGTLLQNISGILCHFSFTMYRNSPD